MASSYIDFTPIGDDESYFNTIKTWQEWDMQHKENLKELEIFRKSHMRFIHQELNPDSKIYTLAVLALTESVAWVEALLKFVDDTHKEYMRSKFSCKRSWSVATRLATALIERISQPRSNLYSVFESRNNAQVAQTIFFCVMQCLDQMVEIRAQGLHNADCKKN